MQPLVKLVKKILYDRNFLSLAGNLGFSFFGFVSFIILTRTLTKEEFGLFTLFLTTSAFIDLFRFGLTRTALVRFTSGVKDEDSIPWLGANSIIGLALAILIAVALLLIVFIFPNAIASSDFRYFFYFYPLLVFANLFWNNALSVLQSWQAFGRIFIVRMANVVSFVVFLIADLLWFNLGLIAIIWANIGSNLLASLITLSLGWDGTKFTFKYEKENVLKILHYGKFSMGTMLGSSLLKSADTFLIGLAPFLGAVGVAKYVIPLKLTELLEIPLRSFMATAFPRMAKFSLNNEMEKWKETFYSYGGVISLLFIPFTIFLFVFAEPIVFLLGGEQYRDSIGELTLIFQIFTVYGLILPLDRISGVALDSLNAPKSNLIKVIFMASVNIIGDLVAIYVFDSLFLVALVTVLNTIIGLIMGYYYLNKIVKIEFLQFFVMGNRFFIDLINRRLIKQN
ncbi:MAG: oligosaccharide flippase family protein [Bacteroidales bacterium]|nr:oligosaccharide flippase family protein [Bacteroidales bacterium]